MHRYSCSWSNRFKIKRNCGRSLVRIKVISLGSTETDSSDKHLFINISEDRKSCIHYTVVKELPPRKGHIWTHVCASKACPSLFFPKSQWAVLLRRGSISCSPGIMWEHWKCRKNASFKNEFRLLPGFLISVNPYVDPNGSSHILSLKQYGSESSTLV